jgi:hypothetical protein
LVVIVKDNNFNNNYLILPAAYGFSDEKYNIYIFPSYYITFILKDLAKNDVFWANVYHYIKYRLFEKILSTKMKFNLIEKKIDISSAANLDVYRVIPYTYMAKEDLSPLKKSFFQVNKFFKNKGYIPFNFVYNSQNQEKRDAPFCVYRFFYMLYGDYKYWQKYKVLKAKDKKNYFCDSFELLLK